MGGKISKKKKKNIEVQQIRQRFKTLNQLPSIYRPFSPSIISVTRNENTDNPWIVRIPNEEPHYDLPIEVKETVLQNKWPEKIPGFGNDHLSSDVSKDHSDDKTYKRINECDLIQHFENKKVSPEVRLPSPPTIPLPPIPSIRHKTDSKSDAVTYSSYDIYTDHDLVKPKIKHSRYLPPPLLESEVQNKSIRPHERHDASNESKEEERNQCMEYREMVNIFKPLIVQNLLVQDILPSLPFLDNHDDIYDCMKNHSPKMAVVTLLDELSKSDELGKWQKFIDALNANGYTYIVDNIRGYRFINHQYQMEYIKNLTPKIGRMIVMRELLPHLVALDLVSECDKEEIIREDANRGNFAASVLFLGRVHKKQGFWYTTLIRALEDANMEEVAADLKIPNLLKTERMKVSEDYGNSDNEYKLPPLPSKIANDSNDFTVYYEEETSVTFPSKGRQQRIVSSAANILTYSNPSDPYLCSMHTRDEMLKKKRKIPLPTQIDSLKIKQLQGKIEERKTELLESHAEGKLLDEMSSLHDELIDSLRKVKRLQKDNVLKEKKVQALRSEDSEVINDEGETEHYEERTDEYYPSAMATYTDEKRDIASLKSLGSTPKQTMSFREVTMLEKSSYFDNFLSMRNRRPASVIQIYSPTFKSRKAMYDLFEQDSGMGVDIATDYDYECNYEM